jgi:hypothetical protein
MTLTDSFARDVLAPREQPPELLIGPPGYPHRVNCTAAPLRTPNPALCERRS